MKTSGFLLLICFVLSGFSQESEAVKYRWPLNINNGYSSSFQEYRSNHFHAGLDFRTFQKTGYPVHAIADGHIYNIRMVKRGSGRGIYIKHKDGNTSIYFHLDRFSAKLEGILKQIQRAKGRKYFGNYYLKRPVPVKKGEVFAYSGETGSGFPHLHLEIRDAQNFAVNPFPFFEFPKKDDNFPRLKSLFTRTRGETLVNGSNGEQAISFKYVGNHVYRLEKPVLITGNVDFILKAVDISDTGRSVSPYKINAEIDGENFFKLVFDRFQRDDNNQLGFVYDMYYSSPKAYFFKLYFQEGFQLEKNRYFFDQVLSSLVPGKHELRITVEDNFGNRSIGLAELIKGDNPGIHISALRPQDGNLLLDIESFQAGIADRGLISLFDEMGQKIYKGELNLENLRGSRELLLKGIVDDFAYLEFQFLKGNTPVLKRVFYHKPGPLLDIDDIEITSFAYADEVNIQAHTTVPGQNISLDIKQGEISTPITTHNSAHNPFWVYKPKNRQNRVLLHFSIHHDNERLAEIEKRLNLIYLEKGVKQVFRYHEFEAEFYPKSVYEPRVLLVEEKNHTSQYPILSRQVDLSPYHFPFLDTVYYKFTKQVENPQQVGIFRYSKGSGRWYSAYTVYNKTDSEFKTRLISSGTFALMRDIYPPEVYLLKLPTRYAHKLRSLVVKITDKGKGVNDTTLKVSLNGHILDCEYDPDWKTVRISDTQGKRKGRNRLKVFIKDRAGNPTKKTFTFLLK